MSIVKALTNPIPVPQYICRLTSQTLPSVVIINQRPNERRKAKASKDRLICGHPFSGDGLLVSNKLERFFRGVVVPTMVVIHYQLHSAATFTFVALLKPISIWSADGLPHLEFENVTPGWDTAQRFLGNFILAIARVTSDVKPTPVISDMRGEHFARIVMDTGLQTRLPRFRTDFILQISPDNHSSLFAGQPFTQRVPSHRLVVAGDCVAYDVDHAPSGYVIVRHKGTPVNGDATEYMFQKIGC